MRVLHHRIVMVLEWKDVSDRAGIRCIPVPSATIASSSSSTRVPTGALADSACWITCAASTGVAVLAGHPATVLVGAAAARKIGTTTWLWMWWWWCGLTATASCSVFVLCFVDTDVVQALEARQAAVLDRAVPAAVRGGPVPIATGLAAAVLAVHRARGALILRHGGRISRVRSGRVHA